MCDCAIDAMSLSVDNESHQQGERVAFRWEGTMVAGRKAIETGLTKAGRVSDRTGSQRHRERQPLTRDRGRDEVG